MILSKSKILILALLLFLLSGFGIVFLLFLRNNDGIGHPVIGKNETHKSGVFINFLNDEVNDFTTTDGLTVSNESEISYNTVSTTIRSPPTILMKTKSEEIEQCQLHIPKFQKGQCNATIESLNQMSKQWLNDSNNLATLNLPHHYNVELRINSKDENVFEGKVQILVETINKTDVLMLHAGRQVSDIADVRINVFKCSNGEPICVRGVTRLIEEQLLLIILSDEIPQGTLIMAEVSYFETIIPNNKGFFIQKSTEWEPWLIGTLLDNAGAHEIFPCINEQTQRATMSLCLVTPSELSARANMPIKSVENMTDLHKICFNKTEALPSNQFGFVIFDSKTMKTLVSKNNSTQIQIFVGKHVRTANLEWILNEIKMAMEIMTSLSGTQLSVPRVTVVSAALTTIDGAHSSGLILLRSSLFEYPKFAQTTAIIVKEVIQQWVSNILTVCEYNNDNFCIQDGLATYLEWIVSEELKTLNITTKSKFYEAYERLLPAEPVRTQLLSSFSECAERAAVVLYSYEHHFNRSVIKSFFKTIFAKYGKQKCATTEDIADVIAASTNSLVSKQSFLSFAKNNGYPLLRVHHSPQGSVSIHEEKMGDKQHSFILPFEIMDATLQKSYHILNGSELKLHQPSRFIVVDPDGTGYQKVVYNVEMYSNIVSCITSPDNCSINASVTKKVFSGLCWALLNNKLDHNKSNVEKWHTLFNKLSAVNGLIEGDCACCIRRHSAAGSKCAWTWINKCKNISLSNVS